MVGVPIAGGVLHSPGVPTTPMLCVNCGTESLPWSHQAVSYHILLPQPWNVGWPAQTLESERLVASLPGLIMELGRSFLEVEQ